MSTADEMTPLQGVAAMEDGVRENVLALQALQEDYQDLFLKFCKEKDTLEEKYEKLYKPLYFRRKEIVTGSKDANEEEIKKGEELAKKEDEERNESKIEEVNDEGEVEENEEPKMEDTEKGVPSFWLTAMTREDLGTMSIVEDHDKPILEHLSDISCEVTTEPQGFVLTFEFEENDYFEDTILKKTYETKLDDKDGEQLLFKATGCDIKWKEGKDVTSKSVKKKQASKSGKGTRVVNKTVPVKSFFGFFEPPFAEDEDLTEEIADKMEEDFMIGTEFKESLIPRAVAWFTGEALVSGFEDLGDDDDEDEEDEEGAGDQKADCKQQ